MQTVYIADLPLAGQGAWTAVTATVEQWIGDRLGLQFAPEREMATSPDGTTEARRRLLLAPDGSSRLLRWDTRQVPAHTPGWAYLTTTWMSETITPDPCTTVRARLQVAAVHGQIAEPPSSLGRPAHVGVLLRDQDVQIDGRRAGIGQLVGTDDVPDLVELLLRPNRLLPVLILTPLPRTGKPWQPPDRVANAIGGLAHVVELAARTTTFALTDALGGTELSVFGGASRLYWPGFALSDWPYKHPLWTAVRLETLGQRPFIDRLFGRLGRLSALTLGAPELETQLQSDDARRRRDAATHRMRTFERAAAEAEQKAAETGAATATYIAELEKTVETSWAAEEEASNERDASQVRVEELEAELAAVRRALVQVQAAGNVTDDRLGASTTGATDEPPTTTLEAVERAADECLNLVFLPEAFTSADESQHEDPELVLRDLRGLDQMVRAWQADELQQGFKPAFPTFGLTGYRDGISATATTMFASDYERTYLGAKIMLGPHLAHGTGAPSKIMRMYWYVDQNNKTFVIGHVGKKLRDNSTR